MRAKAGVLGGDDRPRIGISACLLGEHVRFDGGHKRDPFLTDVLSPHVEWVRVCPEVEVGMGTPREPVNLVRAERGRVRMISVHTGRDWTAEMIRWAKRRVEELVAEGLSGYVLKKSSPSCGLQQVKVYTGGVARRTGRGLFAEALLARLPHLPVEEEDCLTDPNVREHFIERVFAGWRLRRFFGTRWSVGGLAAFHAAHELTLLSHSASAPAALGKLVASAAGMPRADVRDDYEAAFMKVMASPATSRRHTNVLMQMAGHLKRLLDPVSTQELVATIDEYRRGRVPLVVPLSLIRRHVGVHQVAHLAGQTYLEPHPSELIP